MKRAHVIGAGLTGLASAWRLAQAGFDVRVTEASDRVGGLLGTVHTPHGLVERGANAFLWSDTVERWFHELEIEPVFPMRQSRKRYIFRDGRASRWPLTIVESVGLASRTSLSWLTRQFSPRETESVADWSRRVLGAAAADWVVAPALQGIYAAPADRLAARAVFGGHAGSTSRSRRRRVRSAAPSGGMGEFVEKLAMRLRSRGVHISTGTRVDAIDAEVPTVIATGAHAAARLVAPLAPMVGAALGAIEMTAVISATAFLEPHVDDLQGFGVLFPRDCGVEALGVLFNTSIFEGRGALRSETWIYGQFGSANGIPRDVSMAIERDREVLTGRRARPVALYANSADGDLRAELPVYGLPVLRAKAAVTSLPPWLALAGNYLGRLGVAKLLDVATDAAADLSRNRAVSPSSGP